MVKKSSETLGYIVERSELCELLDRHIQQYASVTLVDSSDPVPVPGDGVLLSFSVMLFDSFDGLGEYIAIVTEARERDENNRDSD